MTTATLTGLPVGWKFARPHEAERYGAFAGVGLRPLWLNDTFRFECVGVGECCEHICRAGSHLHKVGPIHWKREGQDFWRCPHLTADRRCGIYAERPMICRLFPLGVNILPAAKRVIVWTFLRPTQCLDCYGGKKWTVAAWLGACGFWERIGALCAEGERTGEAEV